MLLLYSCFKRLTNKPVAKLAELICQVYGCEITHLLPVSNPKVGFLYAPNKRFHLTFGNLKTDKFSIAQYPAIFY